MLRMASKQLSPFSGSPPCLLSRRRARPRSLIKPPPALRRSLRRIALAIAALVLLLAIAFLLFLAAIDRGLLDGFVERTVSARLHRRIRFRNLEAKFLSADPHLIVRGLVIDNPGRIRRGTLAEVDWLRAGFDRAALWHGSFRLRTIAVRGLSLHLIRYGPMRNNWTFTASPGNGPAFAPLRTVESLTIADGRIDVRDYGRHLVLAGRFAQDGAGPLPYSLSGAGRLAGYPVSINLRGGQIHGAAVGQPWPFTAHIVDGATIVDAHGTSGDTFNLGTFDLAVAAEGPNLADLGYLFHFIVPNSAPYRLRAHGRTDGTHFGFSDMTGTVGGSDVAGWIRSDHSQARRQIRASFASRVLERADIEALLAPIPPRGIARSGSGAVAMTGSGRWLLPDAPFGLSRIRAADFDFAVKAGRVGGFALPLRDVSTEVTLQQGVLRFPHFTSGLYGGRLSGTASLDARNDLPRLAMAGRLREARLSQTMMGNALGPNAKLDLTLDVHGPGRSVHDAAGRAAGTIAVRMTGGAVPRRAAWILGGDLLRALGASDKASTSLPVTCAAIDLAGPGGPFSIRAFRIATPVGFGEGSGTVDFGQERMRILMQGRPSQKRLFQVMTPLRIEGPLLKPVLTVLPADHARKLGLKGKLGIALSPLAGLLPLGHDKLPAASADVGC